MDSRYWRFAGLMMAHVFAVQLILPVLAPYFADLGYSDQMISFLFGLFPFVMIFAGLLVGEVSEQIGRSWTIRAALLVSIIAYMLYLWGEPVAIITGRVLDATAFTVLVVLLLAKLEDQLSDTGRGKGTGLVMTLETGGRLMAPLVGGYLADQWLGAPFVLTMLIFASMALLLKDAHFHKKKSMGLHPWRSVRWFVTHEDLMPMAVLGPAMHFLHAANVMFIPLVITKTLGMSYTAVGAVMTAYVAGHLLQYPAGALTDRFGRRRFIIGATTFMSLAVLVLGIVPHDYYFIMVLMGLYGTAASFWNTGAVSHMSDAAEKDDKEGRVLGTYMSISKAGQVLSFTIAGIFVGVGGYSLIFLILGGVGLMGVVTAAALFYVGWLRNFRNRRASAA